MGAIPRSIPRPRLALPPVPNGNELKRIALALALLAIVLGVAYQFWFKTSSFVQVEKVQVVGADSRPDIAVALEQAGREQTTLALDLAALRESVAGDPAVRGLTATTDFPHALTIDVDLRTPVAYLKDGGVVIADDGKVLERGAADPSGVATLKLSGKAGSAGSGGDAIDGEALRLSKLMGAAPAPLLELSKSVREDPTYGPVVTIKPGIDLRFGTDGQSAKKWSAAATVLADPNLTEVAYIDLSVPSRPVAGGVPVDPSAVDPLAEAVPEVPEVAATEVDPAPVVEDPAAVAPVEPTETAPVDPVVPTPTPTPAPTAEAPAATSTDPSSGGLAEPQAGLEG